MFRQQWTDALDNFQSALVYYTQFRPDQKSRIAQIKNMINGCAQEIERKWKEEEHSIDIQPFIVIFVIAWRNDNYKQ